MGEAIAKIKNAKGVVNCNTGDTDGLLVNTLLEALTGTDRLNVGAYGRSTRTPTNYSTAGQSIDQHLAGIDTALGGASLPSGNSGDLLQCSDGTSYVARGAGSGDRILDTVYGTSWDLSTQLAVGTYLKIKSDRLSLGDQAGGSPGTPLDGDVWFNNNGLNWRDTSSRVGVHTGTSHGGDISGTIAALTVNKIQGYSVQSGAPAANDILQYISSEWKHVAGLTPDYDSTWFAVSAGSSYSKTHGLGILPRSVEVYVSSSSGGSPCQLAGWGTTYGTSNNNHGTIVCDITSTTLTVRTGVSNIFETLGFGGTRITLNSGYARVLCWK